MTMISRVVLILLVLLTLASGVAKVLLAEQEVGFFGRFGVSENMLIAFGSVQLLGALLMVYTGSRFAGAAVVVATFLASLVMLLLDGQWVVGSVTAVALLLLGFVMYGSRRSVSS